MGKNKKSNFDGIVSFDMPIHIKNDNEEDISIYGLLFNKKRDMEMTFGYGSWVDFMLFAGGWKGSEQRWRSRSGSVLHPLRQNDKTGHRT